MLWYCFAMFIINEMFFQWCHICCFTAFTTIAAESEAVASPKTFSPLSPTSFNARQLYSKSTQSEDVLGQITSVVNLLVNTIKTSSRRKTPRSIFLFVTQAFYLLWKFLSPKRESNWFWTSSAISSLYLQSPNQSGSWKVSIWTQSIENIIAKRARLHAFYPISRAQWKKDAISIWCMKANFELLIGYLLRAGYMVGNGIIPETEQWHCEHVIWLLYNARRKTRTF